MAKRFRLALASLACLVATVTVGCSSPPPQPSAELVSVANAPIHVAYGADTDQYGLLHMPKGPGPFPVVVLVHGGGWQEANDLSYVEPLAQSLANEGVAVWNIEYRRLDGSDRWPDTLADVDDATEALATVTQRAAGGRLDLDRVHLAGHSSGGHLAAWIAGRHTLPPDAPGAQPQIQPRSATIMAGVLDLELAATLGKDLAVRQLLGGMPGRNPDRYAIASPINHLPIGLPVTAMHGTADDTVNPVQSRAYVNAATRAGDPATLRLLDGVGHGDFANTGNPAWKEAKRVILDHIAADNA